MLVQAKADMDSFLRIIVRKDSWSTGSDFKWLTGPKFRGLGELRWKSMKTQHRIVGYYSGPKTFVALIGCTHKQNRYDPPNALETAVERRKRIERKEAKTSAYNIV